MNEVSISNVEEVDIVFVNDFFEKSLKAHYERINEKEFITTNSLMCKTEEDVYICERCGSIFYDIEKYRNHLNSQDQEVCDDIISNEDLADLLNEFVCGEDNIRCLIYIGGDIVYYNLLEDSDGFNI